MGLRGPRAKKSIPSPEGGSIKKPDWRAKGLSRAARVIRFIEGLKITAGIHAGRRFKLRPWQKEIIRGIYRTNKAGKRIVRQALFTVPRKNGKTQLAAGLALAHLCGPEAEARGQVFSAAADRAQAALLFSEMKAMILADPELSERIIIREFHKTLEDQETGSMYAALSSDANTKHGLSASFVVYDELAQAPNRTLYDVLATSTAARAEPLFVVISTQSPDPNHVMSELVDYGQRVLAGEVDDPAFHATIYAAPEDADPWDEAVWHACNPALGDFRSLDEMRTFAAMARRIGAKEAAFRALYLNQRVDADERYISTVDWLACRGEIDLEALRGRPCYAGLDLSSTTDLTALVLLFPENGGAVLPFFWLPGENLQDREDKDKAPYLLWRRQGHLETHPGRAVDKHAVALRLAELSAMYDLRAIAYDRWRMADLQKILSDEGIELPLEGHGQGFKDMAPALEAFESRLLSKALRHNNPLLTLCAANAVVDKDAAGNRKLNKARSFTRIDGLVALVMACAMAARVPDPIKYDFSLPIAIND